MAAYRKTPFKYRFLFFLGKLFHYKVTVSNAPEPSHDYAPVEIITFTKFKPPQA